MRRSDGAGSVRQQHVEAQGQPEPGIGAAPVADQHVETRALADLPAHAGLGQDDVVGVSLGKQRPAVVQRMLDAEAASRPAFVVAQLVPADIEGRQGIIIETAESALSL